MLILIQLKSSVLYKLSVEADSIHRVLDQFSIEIEIIHLVLKLIALKYLVYKVYI